VRQHKRQKRQQEKNKKGQQTHELKHELKHELYIIEYIGLPVKVVKSRSKTLLGVKGVIIDESKNTFLVERGDGKVVRIPKAGNIFRFERYGKVFDIDGSLICFRPEERPKKI